MTVTVNRNEEQGMAGQETYVTTERVYDTDANGDPVALRHPAGTEIPLTEAIELGLVKKGKGAAAEAKQADAPDDKALTAGDAENKAPAARRRPAKKAAPKKE